MSGCCEYQCDVELRRFRVRGLKCRKREILECARPPDQRNARYRGEMSLKAVGLDRESSLADLQGIGGALACRPFLLHVRKPTTVESESMFVPVVEVLVMLECYLW